MRTIKNNGPLSVQAIAGTYVVLLGINMEESKKDGVLGFAIQRKTLDSKEKPVWILGFKSFKEAALHVGHLYQQINIPYKHFFGEIILLVRIIDIGTR